jgi:group I intron endonuclease
MTNGKNYIGQSVDPDSRWRAHRRDSAKPKVPFHHALKKYGTHNFDFEIIASGILPCTCQPGLPGPCQVDANDEETFLVDQYNSFISNGKGYNATRGGMNAPKSEEWRQHMSILMTEMCADGRKKSSWEYMTPERQQELKEKLAEFMRSNSFARNTIPWNKGIPMTEEQKKKIKAAWNEELRANAASKKIGILNPQYGKPAPNRDIPRSEEQKRSSVRL